MNDEDALKGLPLQYAYLKATRVPVIGWEEGPFAAAGENSKILLFSDDEDSVIETDLTTVQLHQVMATLQMFKGTLSVEDGVAACQVGLTKRLGDTYVEAAMRTIIAVIKERLRERDSAT